MLGLDKLGPGSILVVLIAGGWLTAWAEWARVRVAVQACGCLVTWGAFGGVDSLSDSTPTPRAHQTG
jgi:hypothetical protein